ncbi:MAG: MATE family efflux transporter [Huintestinicola sp.]
MISPEEKRRRMTEQPVEALVCRMAVPTIISMMISALYNMADTYFVGRLDTISTAAVGLTLPLMNIIQATGFFFGHGSGNYISHKLGENDTEAAARMGDTGLVCSLIAGILLSAAGFFNIRPLVKLLGATPLLIENTVSYTQILLIGIPFIMASFTLNNQLRFQGNAFQGMIGMASGAVLNVILDPLFIFVMGMKLQGAALATVISQITGFVILIIMGKRLPLSKIRPEFSSEKIKSILQFGTPSLFRQGFASISAILLNHAAGLYGEAVIAAVSVVNKVVMLGASVVIGFGQGFQPVCGFNMGAKRFDRVKKVYIFCIRTATLFMLVFGAAVFVFSDGIVGFFRDDPDVISAGTPLLRYQCITFALQGIIIMTNMLMQNMGKTVKASILAMSRQGLFFIPCILILPNVLGYFGFEITQSVSDILSFMLTLPISISAVKGLSAQIKNQTDAAQC